MNAYSLIVLDDEMSNVVTAGAIVTVNVLLQRNSMGSLIKGDFNAKKTSAANVSAIDADIDDDKENRELLESEENPEQNQPKKPVWQKKKSGGKKSGGNKKQQPKKVPVTKAATKSPKPGAGVDSEDQDHGENHKELKELPDFENSDDEGLSDGTVSDNESSSDTHDKVS